MIWCADIVQNNLSFNSKPTAGCQNGIKFCLWGICFIAILLHHEKVVFFCKTSRLYTSLHGKSGKEFPPNYQGGICINYFKTGMMILILLLMKSQLDYFNLSLLLYFQLNSKWPDKFVKHYTLKKISAGFVDDHQAFLVNEWTTTQRQHDP